MTRDELLAEIKEQLDTTYDDSMLNRILICNNDMVLDDGTILVKKGAYGKCTADLPEEGEDGLFAIFFAEECLELLREDVRKTSWITFRPHKYIENFNEIKNEHI